MHCSRGSDVCRLRLPRLEADVSWGKTLSNAGETTCVEVAQTLSNAIDYEDADGSISCYGCETGSGKAISKAVAERSNVVDTRRGCNKSAAICVVQRLNERLAGVTTKWY